MRALMADDVHMNGRGPLNFLRRHCRAIQMTAAGAFLFVLGLAMGNQHITQDALNGQSNYFVHSYTPKIAAKAAGDAVQRACPSE